MVSSCTRACWPPSLPNSRTKRKLKRWTTTSRTWSFKSTRWERIYQIFDVLFFAFNWRLSKRRSIFLADVEAGHWRRPSGLAAHCVAKYVRGIWDPGGYPPDPGAAAGLQLGCGALLEISRPDQRGGHGEMTDSHTKALLLWHSFCVKIFIMSIFYLYISIYIINACWIFIEGFYFEKLFIFSVEYIFRRLPCVFIFFKALKGPLSSPTKHSKNYFPVNPKPFFFFLFTQQSISYFLKPKCVFFLQKLIECCMIWNLIQNNFTVLHQEPKLTLYKSLNSVFEKKWNWQANE